MWWTLAAFMVFLVSGTAIAYVMGAAATLAFIAADQARYLAVIPQRIFSQIDVFALMAMPLFILTGELMNRAGVTGALIDFAMSLVGRLKGGLGHVNILTSVFFAGVSGSAVADSAALSNTLVPAMLQRGYSLTYAGAVTAASSVIGPIIPPSIILVVYGALMGTSVAALFIAGIVPGLLLATALFAWNAYVAHRDDHPGGRDEQIPPLRASFVRAAPALLIPFVILGGIVFGVVTPTEAAAISVFTAALVGMLYGKMNWAVFRDAAEGTARTTGSIFMLLCAVASLGYLAGLLQWPQTLAGWVESAGLSGLQYLLLLNGIFLVAGMFMEIPVSLTLLVPLLVPMAIDQGMSSVYLGIVLCFNLCIGLITPPLGSCLIVVSTVTKVGYWALARATLPFVGIEVLVLAALVLVPDISLFLPRLMGFNVQ